MLKLVTPTMSSIHSLRSLRPAAARHASVLQSTRPLSSLSTSQPSTRRSGLHYARTRTRPGPLLVVPSACIALRGGAQSLRGYANGAGGGGGKEFPGFSLGPQHQKGEALKEYSVDLTELAKEGKLDPTIGLLRPKGALQDLGIFVDASTSWGIGIIIGAEWAAFRLSGSWKIAGREICWLETVAVELLAYFLEAKGIRDAHLLIHSDNTGTIGALGKGRSGNTHINLSVRRTHLIFTDLAITPQTEYIESAANPADPISRGEPGLAGRQIFPTFELPDELRDSFHNV